MSSRPRVLVTGATGFIGSHLVPKLLETYDVYVFERYVTGRYVLGLGRNVKTIFGDIRQFMAVKTAIRDLTPDYIIHLAAISPVSYSYEHAHEVIDSNFVGTVNLVEACLRECPNLKQFIFASTSETYGNGPIPKSETTVQNPNSPYAVTKVACEKYLQYAHEAYSFPAAILRPFNTYGRRANHHFVVERTIVQMLQGDTVKLGDPSPVRDLMYIEDHVNAYLSCLGNTKAIGQIFNFCTGRGVSIKELVALISRLSGFQGEVIWNTIPPRPLDIKDLIGDYSKANKTLDWSPKYTLEEGLKLTIEYWRQNLGKKGK